MCVLWRMLVCVCVCYEGVWCVCYAGGWCVCVMREIGMCVGYEGGWCVCGL